MSSAFDIAVAPTRARLFCAALALALGSCSGEAVTNPIAGTGGLGLQLKLSMQVSIADITYQLHREGQFVRSGNFVPTAGDDTFSAFVGGLEPGDGYRMALESNATFVGSTATTRCSGTASFGIAEGETTTVASRLRCEGVSDADLVGASTPTGNVCPSIDMLQVRPAEPALGEPVAVNGQALDPDQSPAPLTFRWSAPSGDLSTAVQAVTTFRCSAVGVVELSLVVSDGDPNCPFEQSSVFITCQESSRRASAAGSGAGSIPASMPASAAGAGGPSQAGSLAEQPGLPSAGAPAKEPAAASDGSAGQEATDQPFARWIPGSSGSSMAGRGAAQDGRSTRHGGAPDTSDPPPDPQADGEPDPPSDPETMAGEQPTTSTGSIAGNSETTTSDSEPAQSESGAVTGPEPQQSPSENVPQPQGGDAEEQQASSEPDWQAQPGDSEQQELPSEPDWQAQPGDSEQQELPSAPESQSPSDPEQQEPRPDTPAPTEGNGTPTDLPAPEQGTSREERPRESDRRGGDGEGGRRGGEAGAGGGAPTSPDH